MKKLHLIKVGDKDYKATKEDLEMVRDAVSAAADCLDSEENREKFCIFINMPITIETINIENDKQHDFIVCPTNT